MRNGIVIPCYNEEKRLDVKRFDQFLSTNADSLLCFVNDGSRDKTLDVLHSIRKNHPGKVVVHDMEANSGKAEAVRAGTLHLLNQYDIETIGYLDADLATDFEDYGRLVDTMNDEDRLQCAFGSRKCGEQEDVKRSFFRNLASSLVALLIHLIIRMPIRDTQCGAKVFKRSVANHIFNRPFHSRWLFDIELFIRMKQYYGSSVINRIREVALNRWEEVEGSKITFNDTVRMPMQLIQIAYTYDIEPILDNLGNLLLLPFRTLVRG